MEINYGNGSALNNFALTWKMEEIRLPLKFPWKISRGHDKEKLNFVVIMGDEKFKGRGEVAFNRRYNENEEAIREGFEKFLSFKPPEIDSVKCLYNCLNELDIPYSLRFGIESAFYDYISQISGKNIYELLGLNSVRSVPTSFSIPIMDGTHIKSFILNNNLNRFDFLKLKINSYKSLETIKEVLKYFDGQLRLDANESFKDPDDVINFVEGIKNKKRIQFIEQPMPSDLHDESIYLKNNLDLEIIADESITTQEVTDYYLKRFHGVNIKLMKSGGFLRAIKQINDSKKLGLKVMIGCMIETSLSISSGMVISRGADYIDLDGCLLLKEDPFSFLGEENGRLIYSHIQ